MHVVKRGDEKTLRWDLERDLTAVTAARVIVARRPGLPPVLARNGVVEDATEGTPVRRIVRLDLTAADYGDGLLEAGLSYYVEVETTTGDGTVLTHPDTTYARLQVVADLD